MQYKEFSPEPIYYFAYGMLTDPANMPEAELIGAAILPNFKFEMLSYANVLSEPGAKVQGTLWQLDRAFLGQLDKVEDCPWLYNRKTVPVYHDGKKFVAELYTMTPAARFKLKGSMPDKDYVRSIIDGYRNAGIPLKQIGDAIRAIVPARQKPLNEVNMSPGALKTFATSPITQSMFMGFEAEMLIPDLEQIDATSYEPDYDRDIPFPSGPDWYAQATDWLTSGDNPNGMPFVERKLNDLQKGFTDFIETKLQQHLESYNGKLAIRRLIAKDIGNTDEETINHEINTEGKHYENAIDNIREHFYNNTNYFPEYLEDERINTMYDFCQTYNLSWPFYDKSYDGDLSFEELKDHFKKFTGYNAKISREYHNAKRGPDVWIFEPDSSIESDGEPAAGVELVSPPMLLVDGLEALNKFWSWADKIGAWTNNSTGFHVGISIKDKTKYDLDIVKLTLFVGDEHVLKTFKRLANDYTVSSMKRLRAALTQEKDDKQYDLDEAIAVMRRGISKLAQSTMIQGMTQTSKKHVSINVRDKYVEFRSAGGNYIERRADIENTILRYVRAIAIAADPTAEKQEYAKKLYKLFDTAKTPSEADAINYFTQYIAGKITKPALKNYLYRKHKTTELKMPKVNPTGFRGNPRLDSDENLW